jgi:hypothetical protein
MRKLELVASEHREGIGRRTAKSEAGKGPEPPDQPISARLRLESGTGHLTKAGELFHCFTC